MNPKEIIINFKLKYPSKLFLLALIAIIETTIDIAAAKILLKERYLEYFAKTITNIITCIYPTISAIRVGVEYVKSKSFASNGGNPIVM